MQLSALRPLQPCPRPLVHSRARGVVTAAAAYREGFHQRQPLPPSAGGWLAAAAAVALLLAAHPVEAKGLIQGSPRVVDGDTLDFSGTRVRLFGIGELVMRACYSRVQTDETEQRLRCD